ncbi:hypothetical protein CCACVL1_02131 [Corchorus capsularis]|uniref:Uncharacterized protein n=1 Tax=Corchorus capsularis TaxID=210143 RepID=A0A1R3KCK3_COCAP|nr:hypothetical protein CCACVL1_02131 [Corchorus capsularis]
MSDEICDGNGDNVFVHELMKLAGFIKNT